jgi:glycosyltransferase involved in cell wall biosynthesis
MEQASDSGTVRPRIRHLTSVHRVEDTRILRRECRGLVRSGQDVALIVGHPPTEPVDGVRIIGVGGPRNRLDRMTRVAWRVLRAARRERADVCHLHDPELIWVGLLLKLMGHRVVYDAHEDVQLQIMHKFWIPTWARRLLSLGAAGAVFDGIVTATPSIAEHFPAGKTVVVQNFPRAEIAQAANGTPIEARKYAFSYAGQLTTVQGIREIMTVASGLPDGMTGVVAGWFDNGEVEREVRGSAGWQRVDYVGELTHDDAVAVMRDSRCGVVVDHPISNYLDSYSTKMFEYMACGIPVVASNFPLWTRLVGDADCGITVDPLDPTAPAAAVRRLLDDPGEAARLGENGRRAILDRFNWEHEFAKLAALYPRILR